MLPQVTTFLGKDERQTETPRAHGQAEQRERQSCFCSCELGVLMLSSCKVGILMLNMAFVVVKRGFRL